MVARNSQDSLRRRSNRSSTLGLMCLALALIVSAIIVSRRSTVVEAREKVAPVVGRFDVVGIPVPLEPVPAGIKVSAIRVRLINYPAQQVPEGALSDLTPYLENVTSMALPAGLPFFRENLSANAALSNPVIERIPDGMRAMTIKVDATSAVEGWAGSGSAVDVLLIAKERTSVVAENVKILSAERTVAPVEGAAAPSVPSTVTLLVSQEQCLAINTAIPLGKIAFALRGSRDSGTWSDADYTADMLRGVKRSAENSAQVNGFISVDGRQSFALSDGRWIKTDVVPQGFFVNRKQ